MKKTTTVDKNLIKDTNTYSNNVNNAVGTSYKTYSNTPKFKYYDERLRYFYKVFLKPNQCTISFNIFRAIIPKVHALTDKQ